LDLGFGIYFEVGILRLGFMTYFMNYL